MTATFLVATASATPSFLDANMGAAGARKPNEAQKAKVLWKMKAAKDRRDFLSPRAQRQHFGKE